MIKENLLALKNELPNTVTLIAVSKTKPNPLLIEAYDAGQRDFGENYVQELVDKYNSLPKDINWHFIGHLQSNKVKFISPFVSLIHGVDSLSLLKEINKQAIKSNRIINCLLQLYIAREDTKFGLSFDEADELLNCQDFLSLKNVEIKGFMAMASNTYDIDVISKEFEGLRNYVQKYAQYKIYSFGMSSDYKLAISHGSTMIRVGSSIFGSR